MKTLTYVGKFDVDILRNELLTRFPQWRVEQSPNYIIEYFGINYRNSDLSIFCPDDTVNSDVDSVVLSHDPTAAQNIDWASILAAKLDFMSIPNWASWTPQEAMNWVNQDIFSGQTEAEVNAWIDANVTTLATAKDALKLVAKEVIDIREQNKRIAYMVMLLRNIVVKRSLL